MRKLLKEDYESWKFQTMLSESSTESNAAVEVRSQREFNSCASRIMEKTEAKRCNNHRYQKTDRRAEQALNPGSLDLKSFSPSLARGYLMKK